ncbi:hypothetical protein [Rhodococcus opacus]|uniref:hypothetical protein n=1 Tax=Rhodococcus opacus TaxID=37919 RepID=UPI0030DD28FE
MAGTEDHPHDEGRTMREHAGEAIIDRRNWPGFLLLGIGIALLAMALVAAGYGIEGWAVVAGTVCVLCFLSGIVLVLLEHRRVKALEGKTLSDQEGH